MSEVAGSLKGSGGLLRFGRAHVTIETAKPVRRRSLVRLVAAGVALGLFGVAVDRLVLTPAALPRLVADLEGDRSAALSARIAARYPAGSAEAILRADLAAQGFAVGSDVAKWSHSAFPCKDFAEVGWTAAGGRLVSTRASMFQACT
jgi:hypothetical protein